jgi:hypothetical protein
VSLRGVTSEFPLESVIGLLAGTSKTGELQVRGGGKLGALGFANGRLVAAVIEGEGGENSLGAIFAIREADFEFTPSSSPPDANLEPGDLVAMLKRAAEARDRLAVMRESSPTDQLRFKLSERAADQGAVTFTPERWRALLVVNGERDVAGIAEQLRLGKMEALSLLAGLVKDGVIETLPPPTVGEPPAPRMAQAPPHNPAPPAAETWTAPEAERSAPREPTPEPEPPEPPSSMAPAAEPSPPEATEMRSDLAAQLAERLGETPATPPPEAAPPEAGPPAPNAPSADDRLASLTGIFAPGPAATAPPEAAPAEPAAPQHDPWASFAPPAGRAADSWTPPPPASTETPANTWAPSTTPSASGGSSKKGRAEASSAPASDWTASAGTPPVEADKKKGGIFGRFRKDEAAAAAAAAPEPARAPSAAAGRAGLLASFSNALLLEYSSGGYGKGKIETRMANLLMRVDEQADPIDRPLPVVDDLIDATALEREGLPEDQAVPYLATLVRQVYEDAERAFGKDKARKGYKAAERQVFGGDADVLRATDLAGKLPKV